MRNKMAKRNTPDYDGMRIGELRKTYVSKAKKLNGYIDVKPLPGARRVDETNIPKGKDGLVMAIQQIDIRLLFGDWADKLDETEGGPILVCGRKA